ncbi:MAG TPA: acetoin utilization protein AcuC, partial [Candidatus Limnocylindrales bacterium]|nr:acetoin utilization protein AcuC [Candidatus Limnocylindrales bacterium]
MADQPLLVFGPRSLDYDFGPSHPLTPRRFGPGIDLLRAVGAEPGLAPEPAPDDELLLAHTRQYVDVVRRFSEIDHGWMEAEAGIGVGGDDPPFKGMHDAAAAVAGGSIRAVEAILRGDVRRAFHPGGGLHHAMPARASGFCVYNDIALAVARARAEGLRVLYLDLDVHHGDGVEAIHAADPGVMTISIHESGRYLFPGTGAADEIGEGTAAGTVVNVPLEPDTGEAAWLETVERIVPELAAAFGPDLIVSQHGADSHAWDPLAHLRNTTTAMGRAARLVGSLSKRLTGGRWLASGGGGYGVYDVVPRSWASVWLALADREAPDRLPLAWRERWADEAARFGIPSLPTALTDQPNLGAPLAAWQEDAERRSLATTEAVSSTVAPALIRAAVARGWWEPISAPPGGDGGGEDPSPNGSNGEPTIVAGLDRARWDGLRLAPRVVMPANVADAHALIAGALDSGATVTAAIAGGDLIVGLVVSAAAEGRDAVEQVLAVGVAPELRRRGVATE